MMKKVGFWFLVFGFWFTSSLVSGGSGNFTICPAGCDYATLAAWESGENGVLTGGGPCIAIINESFEDTSVLVINGWTTTESDYIKIVTVGEARHNGTWGTDAYRLVVGDEDGISISENFVAIDGLQIHHTGTSTDNVGAIVVEDAISSGSINISNNILRGNNNFGWYDYGINFDSQGSSNTGTFRVWNNLIYDFGNTDGNDAHSGGIVANANDGSQDFFVYSNTVVNCAPGIRRSDGDVLLKNNIVQDVPAGSGNQAAYVGTFSGTSVDNVADDATSPNNEFDSIEISFANEAGDVFSLSYTESVVIDAGTDLSGDVNLNFSDDIAGTSRAVGSAWDIGAFEYTKGVIPEDSGNPFYVNSTFENNPVQLAEMNGGTSQIVSWEVHANGTVGRTYEFFAYGDSENYYAESGRVMITIRGGELIITLLNSTDFGVKNGESFVFGVNVSCPAGEGTCSAANLTLDPIVRSKLVELGVDVGEVERELGVSFEEGEVGLLGRVLGFLDGLF